MKQQLALDLSPLGWVTAHSPPASPTRKVFPSASSHQGPMLPTCRVVTAATRDASGTSGGSDPCKTSLLVAEVAGGVLVKDVRTLRGGTDWRSPGRCYEV